MEQSELRSIVRPVAAPASDVSAAEEEILLGLPLSALLILALLSLVLLFLSPLPLAQTMKKGKNPKRSSGFLRAILSCLF